ncbi:hypothetical protein DYU05_10525 [Mucilaginibacter terrenus]|uniref:DUF4251 domain-containing protein n=1 Tax=Mucilaginibacter terrenus TaxID=2482727 RepID=A0A3E2NYB3_9SPHI|nr:hypothetical protein [Mucilaginibacter terrenus]RFZ85993.1 hypothetical protein DYU05_10525 [Mucilaginibacter terrenus]
MKQIKQLLLTGLLLFCIAPAIAQGKKHHYSKKQVPATNVQPVYVSPRLKEFQDIISRANVVFSFPKGFKEIEAPDDEDNSFDYALELPGKEFQIWFQVKSQKQNYTAYQRVKGNTETSLANPDSLYLGMGSAQALALGGTKGSYFVRTIPPRYLAKYNADAGKSYLINLLYSPATNYYKYALLVTLQKDHIGTIMAVCFSNEKGPEFFKNIDRASTCIKFKGD